MAIPVVQAASVETKVKDARSTVRSFEAWGAGRAAVRATPTDEDDKPTRALCRATAPLNNILRISL